MWNLKYDANEPIYETESWAYRTDLQLPKRGELGKGIEWEVWVSRCKLLYLEWINNKVLLYSTENDIQYSMKNYNGK